MTSTSIQGYILSNAVSFIRVGWVCYNAYKSYRECRLGWFIAQTGTSLLLEMLFPDNFILSMLLDIGAKVAFAGLQQSET